MNSLSESHGAVVFTALGPLKSQINLIILIIQKYKSADLEAGTFFL